LARVAVCDPKSRQVAEKLVALVVKEGSVNAASERLNASLAAAHVKTPVYPNRLHTLLSEEPTRFLNEATLALIARALEAVLGDGANSGELTPSSTLVDGVLQRWRVSARSADAVRDIADAMALPVAVVRYVLVSAGELPKVTSISAGTPVPEVMAGEHAAPAARPKPDWSFQETAVRRCLEELDRTPNRKVGLVVPTGGGKTRVALRVALKRLAAQPLGNVVWVTHRRNLRTQAHRELQKMLSRGIRDFPENAAELLAKRIVFIMVGEVEKALAEAKVPPALLIVDEAHHAAAASYRPIFETAYPLRALFLTATPNRTDKLPIGIDDIAYTATYRELADRGVILLPDFEDFQVPDFDWSEERVRELADEVITRAGDDFVKVLVLAPRISRVEEFYIALQDRLMQEPNHPLSDEDIGFVHSTRNSLSVLNSEGKLISASTDEFLEHFAAKPRAIIVSAQLLLEGFNDPELNAVVITYPSASMIVLMQAAGRSVRYTPGKRRAIVLQARNDSLAYHFDQRWLYQEISDYLHPQLVDFDYGDLNELRAKVRDLLARHNTPIAVRSRILAAADTIAPGERCRILLSGIPYYGDPANFETDARWSAVLEMPANTDAFRDVFNVFSGMSASLSDPSDFLRNRGARYGIVQDFADGSEWRGFMDMLTAMYFARLELYEDGATLPNGTSRPFALHGATTWLKYVTFHYRPVVPPALAKFLEDCYNREIIIAAYQKEPASFGAAVKLPLPLGSAEAYLFANADADAFDQLVENARRTLAEVPPAEQIGRLAAHVAQLPANPVPIAIVHRIERYLTEAGGDLVLKLAAEPFPATAASAAEPLTTSTEESSHA